MKICQNKVSRICKLIYLYIMCELLYNNQSLLQFVVIFIGIIIFGKRPL